MKLAIQLVTYRSSADLPTLLESLKRQTFEDWELFVCENSCDAEEAGRVKHALAASGVGHHLYISPTNGGFDGGHNELYAMHMHPFVLLLNADAYMEPIYLANVMHWMNTDHTIGSVSGLVYRWKEKDALRVIDTAGLVYHCLGYVLDRFAAQLESDVLASHGAWKSERVFGVSGAIGLYRRAAIEAAGGLFDAAWFMYKEDVDLAIRLQRAGYTAWFEPTAIAWHRRGLKEEERGLRLRVRNERARSPLLRQCAYVNQWRLYARYWRTVGWRDRFASLRIEFLRSLMVFVASPSVFFRSWKTIGFFLWEPLKNDEMRGAGEERSKLYVAYGVEHRSQQQSSSRFFSTEPLKNDEMRGAGEERSKLYVAYGVEHRSQQQSSSRFSEVPLLPKIGLIYLTYPTTNGQRDIDRCLSSLEKLSYPQDRIELICVESKGTLPPIKPWFEARWMPKSGTTLPRIHYVFRDEWIGFSGNNNLGLEKARELGCEYVHLTNEDTDVDSDYLLRAVERAERDPQVACVQSLILLGDERALVNSCGNAFHYLGFGYSRGYRWSKEEALRVLDRERKINPDLEIGYASGAAVLVRMAALEGEPLFDERFFSYHEDTDLCLRLRLRGWKTVIEPTSIVWHYYEFAKAKINFYWMERNRYVLVFSYYRPWTLFMFMPILIVLDMATLAFSWQRNWLEMKWRVYRDLCSLDFWRWIRLRRHSIQRERILRDRTFLRNAVATIEFQEEAVRNPVLTFIGNPLLKAYWWVARRLI